MMNIMNPPADWSTMKKLIWLRGTPITGGEELTVSGTPPLSLPNSLGKPLKAWSVDVVPYQDGTGDPAPDNIRPIHGTNKLNLFVEESYDQSATPKAVIDVPPLGKNKFNAYTATWKKWIYYSNVFTVEPDTYAPISITKNTNQTVSVTTTNSWCGVCVEIEAVPYDRVVSVTNAYRLWLFDKYETGAEAISTASGLSQIIPANTSCVAALLFGSAGNYTITMQIEDGTTASSYEPSNNTVYTGTIGSEGGESRSGAKHFSDLTWTANGSFPNTFNGEGFIDRQTRIDGSNENGCYCDRYKWYTSGTVGTSDGGIALANTPLSGILTMTRIYVKDTRFSTVEDFVASFATEDPLIVCPLAEPVQFPLTAPTIPTPTGTATTWATAEDGTVDGMEVTYIGKA